MLVAALIAKGERTKAMALLVAYDEPVVTTIQAPVGAVPITLSPNNKAAGEKSCNGDKNAAKVH